VVEFIESERTPFTSAELPAYIADAHVIILDAARRPAERIEALNKLPLTPEAMTDAVVAAAIELATIAPRLRGMVWYTMRGVDNPYLIEPLLDSLAYDADEYVRRTAAGALGAFVAEPRVKAALEHAQTNDASEAVRDAAQQAFLTDEERDELALETLLDETLPARERLGALLVPQFTGRSMRRVPLTDEAARAVFEIGLRSTDAGVRSWAWSNLRRVYDPSFTDALLDDLANHPSDSVRSQAAGALAQYADDLTVRATLEQAESDPSFEVRRAARRALGKVSR
jgi:HEAT repeat protein